MLGRAGFTALDGSSTLHLCLMVSSLCLVLGGCATLEHGGSDEVPVVTDPPGATVTTSAGTTSAGPSCRSPCRVYVERKDEFTVTVSKAGFGTQGVEVKAHLAGSDPKDASQAPDENKGAALIDTLVGATFVHVPNPVVVKLAPAG